MTEPSPTVPQPTGSSSIYIYNIVYTASGGLYIILYTYNALTLGVHSET